MRVAKLQMRIAMLAALAFLASSCQTAQKPASLLPAKTAPALTASTSAAPQPAPQTQSAPSTVNTPKPPQAQALVPAQAPVAEEAKPESPAPTPAADRVAVLISGVEKDYQAGLDAYHAGQTDAAKQDFDNAINALLESNLDIRSDDRLEKEFDRIVQGVNSLDLASLGYA